LTPGILLQTVEGTDQNQRPKPFVWTADPDKIIAAANRTLSPAGFIIPN
jgi:hypothetical protein